MLTDGRGRGGHVTFQGGFISNSMEMDQGQLSLYPAEIVALFGRWFNHAKLNPVVEAWLLTT